MEKKAEKKIVIITEGSAEDKQTDLVQQVGSEYHIFRLVSEACSEISDNENVFGGKDSEIFKKLDELHTLIRSSTFGTMNVLCGFDKDSEIRFVREGSCESKCDHDCENCEKGKDIKQMLHENPIGELLALSLLMRGLGGK